MKLGLVSWGFDTLDGVGRCVVESAARLSAFYDVHVFAATANHPPISGVTVHKIPLLTRSRYPSEIEYLIKIKRAVSKAQCDVVHCHIPARLRADILTCHSLAAALLETQDISLRVRLPYMLQNQLYRYHFQHPPTLIATVSQAMRQQAAERYQRSPDSLLVIANGVDLERFHPERVSVQRQQLRQRLKFADDQFVFGLIGSSLRLKGAHFAAEVIARLPERAVLMIVGHGNPTELSDNQDLIEGLIKAGRLFFVTPEEDIACYYGVMDALIFPSQYESFGLVLLEAMACGLPVLTANTVGLAAEAIEDGVNGFAVQRPDDVQGLFERAQHLMETPHLAQRIAVQARQVAEQYSWDQHVAQTRSAYQQILSARQERGH